MPPLLCPRCKRPNPDTASYCHFDGSELRSGSNHAAAGQLNQEFIFPSGKRCRTFDELAQACQDDWGGARDLLRQGVFVRYFSSVGRMDLARAAQEGMAQPDADMGLSNLVGSLPQVRMQGPRLDINPRRLAIGTMFAGDTKQIQLVVSNQGQGMLQGTLTVAEGGEWLRIHGSKNGQCSLQTPREQKVSLTADTRGLAAGQAYGARLTVITNGGAVEVAARLELAAHPFQQAPFQGVRAKREMAERMIRQRKAAAQVLEGGAIGKWFELNGWNFPVRGTPAKGVAGVQQFFECLGLSRPPVVQLSQTEASYAVGDAALQRGQVVLSTGEKKWVYANVESDAPWIKVLTPQVSGPQQALIGFSIDARLAAPGRVNEGTLTAVANGGQQLALRIRLQSGVLRSSLSRRVLQPVLTCTLMLLLLRLAFFPVVDLYGRAAAASAGLDVALPPAVQNVRPSMAWGGWLNLPWRGIYFQGNPEILKDLARDWQKAKLQSAPAESEPAEIEFDAKYFDCTRDFRDYFTSYILRLVIGCTWWIGAVLGVFALWRRGSFLDCPWGLVAGAAAGIAGSATLGIAVLALDLVPQIVWDFGLHGSGVLRLPIWGVLVLTWWTLLGAGLGVLLSSTGPIGRLCLLPFQSLLSDVFLLVGLRKLSLYFAPLGASGA
jgi:hypothetical protein